MEKYVELPRLVLRETENKALIAKLNRDMKSVYEYVVCDGWDGETWRNGTYFDKLDDALKCFNSDILTKQKAMLIAYNAICLGQLDEFYDTEALCDELGCTIEELKEIME